MNCKEQYYLCLECGEEFRNELNIAICPKCLEKEKNNFKKGFPSKYRTVTMLLKNEKPKL